MKLLSREEFRKQVFARDKHKCVICGKNAKDPHHIIERRLFKDNSNGYYLDNGASVCADCHIDCEKTKISCEDLRKAAGIRIIVLPPNWDATERYDKWGNVVLPNGKRLPGPLFEETGVQKILKESLHLFQN